MLARCSHQIRGPKKGRIYIYDAKQCRRMVEVPEGEAAFNFIPRCWQHVK